MKPIFQRDQTIEGDCLAACIASLMEVELDEIPDFTKYEDDWFNGMQLWFEKRGLCVLNIALPATQPWYAMPGNPWAIFVGLSEAGVPHSVVGRCEGDRFAIVHDPHPNQRGVDKVDSVIFIVPLDPAILKRQLVIAKPKILTATVMPDHAGKIRHRFRDNGK